MKGKRNISTTICKGVRVFSIQQGKFLNHFLGCKRLQREMREVTALRTFESLTKASETAAQSPGQQRGEPSWAAKGLLVGFRAIFVFTTTDGWKILLFCSCQWKRRKSFLQSEIVLPRWGIHRGQAPVSHSRTSLLIVLGLGLPPSSAAIGPAQDRTSLFCLIKFYCVAFRNNNSYPGTLKGRKAHRQENTGLQLIRATGRVA